MKARQVYWTNKNGAYCMRLFIEAVSLERFLQKLADKKLTAHIMTGDMQDGAVFFDVGTKKWNWYYDAAEHA